MYFFNLLIVGCKDLLEDCTDKPNRPKVCTNPNLKGFCRKTCGTCSEGKTISTQLLKYNVVNHQKQLSNFGLQLLKLFLLKKYIFIRYLAGGILYL